MRNIQKSSERFRIEEGSTLDTGSNGLVLLDLDNGRHRIHFGVNGWLYVNNEPFGVQGMPPAPHNSSHFSDGEDPIMPSDIGAASSEELQNINTSLLASIAAQSQLISDMQATITAMQANITSLQESITTVETYAEGLEVRIAALESGTSDNVVTSTSLSNIEIATDPIKGSWLIPTARG